MSALLPAPPGSGKTLLDRVEDGILPLINLVFLLLMFFIVAGHLADDPLPALPEVAVDGDREPPKADVILLASGEWRVGSQTVAQENLLNALPVSPDERPVRIAAHRDTTVPMLESLLRLLEAGGYQEVLLLTEPSP
ncbi:MAG: biopolymer transporter ExbD [Marinobacter sp.]|nr:biopolymer transporter ExbD [Marinobacter sp.]